MISSTWRAGRVSQRYDPGNGQRLAEEAAMAFGGQVVLAHDLDRIPVPPRRRPTR